MNTNTKQKEFYEPPTTEVLEVKQEGIICASGLNNPTDYPGNGDPFNF
jgi:hypothetical protein